MGRAPYERRSEEHPAGSRNGWQPPVALKTTLGPVGLSRPKLRDTDEKFCSQLFGLTVTGTNALEALVVPAQPPHRLRLEPAPRAIYTARGTQPAGRRVPKEG